MQDSGNVLPVLDIFLKVAGYEIDFWPSEGMFKNISYFNAHVFDLLNASLGNGLLGTPYWKTS